MTAEHLASTSALILSLALGYIPGLRERYDALPPHRKVAVTGALLVAVAAISLLWGCRTAPDLQACLLASWEQALDALIAALVASQAGYTLLVRPFRAR